MRYGGLQRRRAIFLDRDGTLVHPRHYPSQPQDLRVYDGIGPELRALRQMGFRLVVITNQSGVARDFFSTADLDQMHAHLRAQLGAWGVRLDGIYYCPHHPDGVIPELAIRCKCRKPQPGMLLRAAEELRLSLADSWLVGDILDDVEAGHRAGCRSVLVDLGTESPPTTLLRQPDYVARDTRHALRIIRYIHRLSGAGESAEGAESGPVVESEVETDYQPAAWQLAAAAQTGQELRNG